MQTNLEHFCSVCQYGTNTPSNFKKHLKTSKHLRNSPSPQFISKTTSFSCSFCGLAFGRKDSLKRHLVSCSLKKSSDRLAQLEQQVHSQAQIIANHEQTIADQTQQLADQAQIITDQAQTISDQAQTIADLQQTIKDQTRELIDFSKATTRQALERPFNFNYIVNNYPNAPNIEDCLATSLSDQEQVECYRLGPVRGSVEVLLKTCVNNRPVYDRPFWDLDASRKTCAIKSNGVWKKDQKYTIFRDNFTPICQQINSGFNTFLDEQQLTGERKNEHIQILKKIYDEQTQVEIIQATMAFAKYNPKQISNLSS